MAVDKKDPRQNPKVAKKPDEKKKDKQKEDLIRIRLKRSIIGKPRNQREVVKGLGLRRINSEVLRRDCPETWGMIKKIPHLLDVEEAGKK